MYGRSSRRHGRAVFPPSVFRSRGNCLLPSREPYDADRKINFPFRVGGTQQRGGSATLTLAVAADF